MYVFYLSIDLDIWLQGTSPNQLILLSGSFMPLSLWKPLNPKLVMVHGDLPHLLLNKYPSAIELKYILYHPIASCIPTSRCMSFAFRWLAKSNFGWIKKMHIRTISTVQYMPVLLLYPSSSISYITSHYPHLSVYIYTYIWSSSIASILYMIVAFGS